MRSISSWSERWYVAAIGSVDAPPAWYLWARRGLLILTVVMPVVIVCFGSEIQHSWQGVVASFDVRRANNFLAHGNDEAALAVLIQANVDHPDQPTVLRRLAQLYAKDHPSDSAHCYRQLMDKDRATLEDQRSLASLLPRIERPSGTKQATQTKAGMIAVVPSVPAPSVNVEMPQAPRQISIKRSPPKVEQEVRITGPIAEVMPPAPPEEIKRAILPSAP